MSERFTITIEPVGPGAEPIIRVRKLLKIALRACGLRCVEPVQYAGELPVEPTPTMPEPVYLSDRMRERGCDE